MDQSASTLTPSSSSANDRRRSALLKAQRRNSSTGVVPRRHTFPKRDIPKHNSLERRKSTGFINLRRPSTSRQQEDSTTATARTFTNYNHLMQMTKLHLVQRSTSSKAAVKKVLVYLKDLCCVKASADQHHEASREVQSSSVSQPSPESYCEMLSELALDAYFQVLIRKNDGVAILTKVMKSFPINDAIQASCRTALSRLLKDDGLSSTTSSSSMPIKPSTNNDMSTSITKRMEKVRISSNNIPARRSSSPTSTTVSLVTLQ